MAPAANFWKRDISSVSEKAFPGFWLLNSLKKNWGCTQEFTCFLSGGIVPASSHMLWRVLSNKVIWVLGHCWVDTPLIHTSEEDTLFFQSCLLSSVTVTPSDSDYVNKSASLKRVRSESTEIVHTLLFGELLVWCIQDHEQDSNEASTPTETSGLSAQDHYCARSVGSGSKKRRKMKKNGYKSSNCDFHVSCDDVRCFL